MDSLMALTHMEEAPAAPSRSLGSAGDGGDEQTTTLCAVGGEPSDITPAKRRRRASPFGLLSARSSEGLGDSSNIVKEELDDQEDADRRSSRSGDAAASEAGESKSKACNGCYRNMDSGKDWVHSDQNMSWAHPNGRGFWCRDCHNLWRLRHSDMSLLLFGQWLKQEDNWAKWETDQLAYISLMVEGCSRISQETLAARVRMLQWLSAQACVPLRLSTVVPLSEYAKDPASTQGADPRMLTTMMVGGSMRLAMQIPRARSEAGLLVERPTHVGEVVLSTRRWLLTEDDNDPALLLQVFERQGECKIQQPSLKDDEDEDTGTPGKHKLSRGVQALAGTFEGLFKRFTENDWETIKESSFTGPYNKMAGLQVQAEGKGDGPTIKVAQGWCKGIASAKAFLARHRDFAKAKSRNARLLDLWPSLEELADFLQTSLKASLAPSLGLLRFKVLFWRELTESKEIAKATAVLVGDGFLGLVQGLSATDRQGICVDSWLRALVLSAAADRLGETDTDNWEEDVRTHEKDCAAALEKLRQNSCVAKVCQSSLDDFGQYIVILRSASQPDTVQAQALSDALDRLNDPCMTGLKQALHHGPGAGKQVCSAASCLMQVSAKDGVADGKLLEAIRFLEDENLPSIAKAEDPQHPADAGAELTAVVSNFKVLSDMSAVDMLDESLRCMSESLGLWSKVRLDQQAGSVQKWLEQLDSHVRFFDEVLCLFLSGITLHPSVQVLFDCHCEEVEGEQQHDEVDTISTTVQALMALKGLVSKYGIDEQPLSSFLNRYKHALQAIDSSFNGSVNTDNTKTLVEDKIDNVNSRTAVYTLFSVMSKIDCMPATAKEAVEEWAAKKEVASEKDSFLSRGGDLMQALETLTHHNFTLSGEDLECTLRLDEVDGVFSLTGNYNTAKRLCENLVNMPLAPIVKNLMLGAVNEAFNNFVASLHLNSLKVDARSTLKDAGHIALPAALDTLVDRHTLGDGIKYASKHFAAGGKDPTPWAHETLAALVSTLLRSLPDGTGVSVRRLCKPVEEDDSQCTFDDKGDIAKVCGLFSKVSQLVVVIGFIREKCFGGEVVHKMHKVKAELASAVTLAMDTSNKLLTDLEQDFAKSHEMKRMPWLIGMASMTEWVSLVVDHIPLVGSDILSRTLGSVVSLSAELEKVTPRHEHAVTDTIFNKQLARQLLKWPSRATLNEKTTMVFGALKDLQRLQSLWKLSPPMQDREDTKDHLSLADSRYRSARTAITIIAAVDVILSKSGEEQRADAETLFTLKADTIPKAALAELSKLVRKQPVTSKTT